MSVFTRPKKVRKGQRKRWHYEFCVRGERYRGALPEARTKWHAEQAETLIRQQVYEGKFGGLVNAPRLKNFIDETNLPWAKGNKRSCRDDVWRSGVLIEYFGTQRMDEISPFQIERFKQERRAGLTWRGTLRTPASVNRELEVLSRIFSIAIDNGMNIQNPCRKVKLLRMDNQRNRYLSEDEETRLMAILVGRRAHLRSIVILALHTGMRRGEILSLRWNQIDFARGLILVQRTKSGRDRMIPMNSIIRETLAAIRGQATDDQVFPINDVKRSFVYACGKAKIADFHFHDLRHTAATRLADRGADAFQIAAILGHATIQMSARYTHATDHGLRRAMESLTANGLELRETSPTISPQFGVGQLPANVQTLESRRLAS
ncbi:MAG TPA: site-specific integrase [Pyrinomonadaceae bacterium]|nr:site-specific integrase [Pyrinomonadaceae bacterium]